MSVALSLRASGSINVIVCRVTASWPDRSVTRAMILRSCSCSASAGSLKATGPICASWP